VQCLAFELSAALRADAEPGRDLLVALGVLAVEAKAAQQNLVAAGGQQSQQQAQPSTQQEVAGRDEPQPAAGAHLLVMVALRMAQLNEDRREDEWPVASGRAARLRELKENPPEWLNTALHGRPMRSKSDAVLVLAWRVSGAGDR
jgi:hypothetical protein